MNDWVIFHHEDDSNPTIEHDWATIDTLIARLAELQAAENSPRPTGTLVDCIAELEQAIASALSQGVSVRAIGVRANLSQSDVTRVRDTGRLYE